MKKTIFITLIAILSFAVIPANAQFGGIKKAIKDKAKKEEPKPEATPPQTDGEKRGEKDTVETVNNERGGNANGTVKTAAQAGFDPKFPPGLMFASLLQGMRLSANGDFGFNAEQTFTFLPPPNKSGSENYDMYKGEKLEAAVKNSGGSEVGRFRFAAQPVGGPYWRPQGSSPLNINLKTGDYTLEFYLDNALFYRFPFSIVKEGGNGDPFAGGSGDELVFKGAWNDYGYFHVSEGNLDRPLSFKVWLRAPDRKSIKYKLELIRQSDNKIIGVAGGEDYSLELIHLWRREDFSLFKGTTTRGSQLFGSDVLTKDGDYKLKLILDGEIYGEYPFSVKGGKFVYLPEQTRGKADMTTFLEGGNDAWFVKKQ